LNIVDCKDGDKPLIASTEKRPDGSIYPVKEGLFDPDNKATQLILWFYSIEPSFYDELNVASINMNFDYLDTLGPFA